ncbi:MAG: NAD(+) kinase [Gammaproteobacteria bacterium]|nr:NAD(+) kinase [Gammaproteobacteria bacterium]
MKDIKNIKCVGLILKYSDRSKTQSVAEHLVDYLLQRFDSIVVRAEDKAIVPDKKNISFVSTEEFRQQCELAFSIGGDGTLLQASHICSEYDIPIIGINLGRLGFLVEISPDNFHHRLDEILGADYRMEERIMLEVTLHKNEAKPENFIACNDITIRNKNTVRMLELDTQVDNVFLNTIHGDGLIISTPTGSTAYALASGGPLLEPTMEAILLVPICPHTLSQRPLVIDSKKVIEVAVTEGYHSDAVAAIDGQITRNIETDTKIIIKRSAHKLKLIQTSDHDYFTTLRNKLGWSAKP